MDALFTVARNVMCSDSVDIVRLMLLSSRSAENIRERPDGVPLQVWLFLRKASQSHASDNILPSSQSTRMIQFKAHRVPRKTSTDIRSEQAEYAP
jgi:hypothetical protein